MDEFDKQAERLVPCKCDGAYFNGDKWIESHPVTCAARYRPAVAAALREKCMDHSDCNWKGCAVMIKKDKDLADLHAEIAALKAQVADAKKLAMEEAITILQSQRLRDSDGSFYRPDAVVVAAIREIRAALEEKP